MSRKQVFSKQLGEWLSVSDWHYSTLLAVLIDTVNHPPPDASELIHELLAAFDNKPTLELIVAHLSNSDRLHHWLDNNIDLKVSKICLSDNPASPLAVDTLPSLHSESDIAQWLGIPQNELTWFADLYRYDRGAADFYRHYHYSIISKRNGSPRLIESPKIRLREIQRKILREIVEHVPIHDAAHGFRKTRSCKTHAALHCGKTWLFTFDLSNYFQSIHWSNVCATFDSLGYAKPVSKLLSALTTHHCHKEDETIARLNAEQQALLRERHLPQGAPCSPALSNAVLYHLDYRLTGLAKSLDLVYSRYGDDLAFSGNTNRDWNFLQPLIGSICLEQGLSLNYRKTRIMKPNQKQRLTGVIVNAHPNIDRQYYDKLKATLTNCSRYGIEHQNRDNHPNFSAYLQGAISHVKHLNPKRGKTLEAIYNNIRW